MTQPAHAPALSLSHDELAAWLRLALTPGVGNGTARRLLAQFSSPQAVFSQSLSALQTCASAAQAAQLRQLPPGWDADLATAWAWLQGGQADLGHALVTLGDPRYPPALLQTEDPPLMLYVQGPTAWLQQPAPLLDSSHALAIVGSRNPTAQGRENAHRFAQTLGQQGWCVVSGLALGVDAAAHQGALQSAPDALPSGVRPRTVAVVGTGLDMVYPRAHQALAQQIARQGFIVSEYPLGTPPLAANFPKRNRLIAGLSTGTLVVEAAVASGSLITARLAAEQGREVFAIPGSIHAPQSKGCHALLRQGAKLVESVQDILEELPAAPLALQRLTDTDAAAATATVLSDWPPAAASPLAPPVQMRAEAAEHPVLAALGHDPMGFDQLQARTGWDTPALQAWLLEQELDGAVARLPGGLFQRLVRG